MKRTALALALILALSILAVAGYWFVKPYFPKTITVPDDYPTIRAAIGNATAGDTVFVKSGTYSATWLEIDKPLQLMGQDPNNTILNGKADVLSPGGRANLEAITISSSNVLISGFTFTNCQNAIVLRGYSQISGISITKNNFVESYVGISLERETSGVMVSENYFSSNGHAISFRHSNNSVISRNTISGNYGGIYAYGENLKIFENNIVNNSWGISLQEISHSYVYRNAIIGNTKNYESHSDYGFGIQFGANCNNSQVYDNIIEANIKGVNLRNYLLIGTTFTTPQGSGNLVYHNNFFNNTHNANVEHQYPWPEAFRELSSYVNGTDIVSWDNGLVGNYWSDYDGQGTYVIDENNVDHYPLMQEADISIIAPEPAVGISLTTIAAITAVSAVVIVIGFAVYFKKRSYAKINKHSEIEQSST